MVKNTLAHEGEVSSVPGSRRSPGEGNGYPVPYSYLRNPMDRGAWWATIHRVARSQIQLSDEEYTHSLFPLYDLQMSELESSLSSPFSKSSHCLQTEGKKIPPEQAGISAGSY